MIIPLFKTSKHCPKCKKEIEQEHNGLMLIPLFRCYNCLIEIKPSDVLVVKWIQETEHERLMTEEYNKGYMSDR